MAVLTYVITSTTRTNSLTASSVTTKTVKPSVDGAQLMHHYVFSGGTTDADAKAIVKADLEGPKGYGALIDA